MSAFNTSIKKEDFSIKLRAQNIRHAKENTKRLEQDNRKMEERLRELKTAMEREKELREHQGGGFWTKGGSGNLHTYASDVLKGKGKPDTAKMAVKKKGMKLLKDEPLDLPVRDSGPGTMKFIAQHNLSPAQHNLSPAQHNLSPDSVKDGKDKGAKCGQCEDCTASLTCVQCSENYCAGCFAAFHLKGALKRHRNIALHMAGPRHMSPRTPVTASSRSISNSGSSSDDAFYQQPEGNHGASEPEKTVPQPISHSLLDGAYNEEDSAAVFQKALLEWRHGEGAARVELLDTQAVTSISKLQSHPHAVTMVEHSTCTASVLPIATYVKPSKYSLSYVQRLLLKKNRRGQESHLRTPRLGNASASGDSDIKELMNEEEEHVDFQSLYEAITASSAAAASKTSYSRFDITEVTLQASARDDLSSAMGQTACDNMSLANQEMSWPQSNDGEVSGPQSSDHLLSAGRETSRPQSRDDLSSTKWEMSRPQSRPASRLSGPGILTKAPTACLQDIARRAQDQRSHYHSPMEGFFLAGIEMKGLHEDPYLQPAKTALRPTSALDKKKISNKLYTMSPRSWRPSSSVKAAANADRSGPVALEEPLVSRSALAAAKSCEGKVAASSPPSSPPSSLVEPPAAGTSKPKGPPNRKMVPHQMDSRPYSAHREDERANLVVKDNPASKFRPNSSTGGLEPNKKKKQHLPAIDRDLETPHRARRKLDKDSWTREAEVKSDEGRPVSQTFSAARTRSWLFSHNAPLAGQWETQVEQFIKEGIDLGLETEVTGSKEVMSARSGSLNQWQDKSGRVSRAVVMDGEDLSKYDADGQLDRQEQNTEDNETLSRLEWELASDTGRLTSDGNISSRSNLQIEDNYDGGNKTSWFGSRASIFLHGCDKDFDITTKLRHAELSDSEADERLNSLDQMDEEAVRALH